MMHHRNLFRALILAATSAGVGCGDPCLFSACERDPFTVEFSSAISEPGVVTIAVTTDQGSTTCTATIPAAADGSVVADCEASELARFLVDDAGSPSIVGLALLKPWLKSVRVEVSRADAVVADETFVPTGSAPSEDECRCQEESVTLAVASP